MSKTVLLILFVPTLLLAPKTISLNDKYSAWEYAPYTDDVGSESWFEKRFHTRERLRPGAITSGPQAGPAFERLRLSIELESESTIRDAKNEWIKKEVEGDLVTPLHTVVTGVKYFQAPKLSGRAAMPCHAAIEIRAAIYGTIYHNEGKSKVETLVTLLYLAGRQGEKKSHFENRADEIMEKIRKGGTLIFIVGSTSIWGTGEYHVKFVRWDDKTTPANIPQISKLLRKSGVELMDWSDAGVAPTNPNQVEAEAEKTEKTQPTQDCEVVDLNAKYSADWEFIPRDEFHWQTRPEKFGWLYEYTKEAWGDGTYFKGKKCLTVELKGKRTVKDSKNRWKKGEESTTALHTVVTSVGLHYSKAGDIRYASISIRAAIYGTVYHEPQGLGGSYTVHHQVGESLSTRFHVRSKQGEKEVRFKRRVGRIVKEIKRGGTLDCVIHTRAGGNDYNRVYDVVFVNWNGRVKGKNTADGLPGFEFVDWEKAKRKSKHS